MAENGDYSTPLDSFRESLASARSKTAEIAEQSFRKTQEALKESNPFLAEKLEKTAATVTKVNSDFEELGFWTNYKNYNIELFRPFKRADPAKPLMVEIQETLTLKPENPKMAFVMWNVLCFWLGVLDVLVLGLFQASLFLWVLTVAAVDFFAGYAFAYFFYFVFVCSEKKSWMKVGFAAIAIYVATVLYLAYASVMTVDILGVVLNVAKAIANGIVGYHAYLLFTAAPAEASKEML